MIKSPEYGVDVNIANDFTLEHQGKFTPKNEQKAIPELYIWRDNLSHWWNKESELEFENECEDDSLSNDDFWL